MDKDKNITPGGINFIFEIKQIVTEARQKAYSAINSAMVEAYWLMGKRIVEEQQQGKERADYGAELVKELSNELTKEFGKGFSVNTLYYFRQFYSTFPQIFPTVYGILSWSHYKRLITVSNPDARAWYLKEAAEQMWSYRTLDDIARYSVLHDNNQLFASKYMLYMPTEEELRNEIERQKNFYLLQHTKKQK